MSQHLSQASTQSLASSIQLRENATDAASVVFNPIAVLTPPTGTDTTMTTTSTSSVVTSLAPAATTWSNPSVFFVVMYALVFILSWLGNTIILIVIIRRRRMRNVTNFFIANIAIANLMYAPCAIIQSLTVLKESWFLHDFMCPLLPFFSTLTIIVNTSTMIAASIERLIVIIYPFKSKMGKCKCVIVICLIWLFAIVSSLPWLHFIRIQVPSSNNQSLNQLEQQHQHAFDEIHLVKKRSLDELINFSQPALASGKHLNVSIEALAGQLKSANITTAHPDDIFNGMLNTPAEDDSLDQEDLYYDPSDESESTDGEDEESRDETEDGEDQSSGANIIGEQTRLCVPFEYGYLIRIYIGVLCIIQYFMPLLTLCVSYAVIAYYILHINNRIEARFEMKIHNQHVSNRNKKRLLKELLLGIIGFNICWLPMQLNSFLDAIHPDYLRRFLDTFLPNFDIKYVWVSVHWLAFSHFFHNPFIHGLFNTKFKMEIKNLFKCTYQKVKFLFKVCICKKGLASDELSRNANHGGNYTRRNNKYSVDNSSSFRIPAEQMEPLILANKINNAINQTLKNATLNVSYPRSHQQMSQLNTDAKSARTNDEHVRKQVQTERLKKEMGASNVKLLNMVVKANKAASTSTMNKNLNNSHAANKKSWLTSHTSGNRRVKSAWPVSFLFSKSKQPASKSLNMINNTNYTNSRNNRRSKSKSSSSLIPVTWPCSDFHAYKPYPAGTSTANSVFYHNNFLETSKNGAASKKFNFAPSNHSNLPVKLNYFRTTSRSGAPRTDSSYSIYSHKFNGNKPAAANATGGGSGLAKSQASTNRFKLHQPFFFRINIVRSGANRNSKATAAAKATSRTTTTSFLEKVTMQDLNPRTSKMASVIKRDQANERPIAGGGHSISSASSTPTSNNASKKQRKVLFKFHRREQSTRLLNDYMRGQVAGSKPTHMTTALKLDELVTGRSAGHAVEKAAHEDKLSPLSSFSYSSSFSQSSSQKSQRPLVAARPVLETSFEENVKSDHQHVVSMDDGDGRQVEESSSPVKSDPRALKLENHSV